MQHEQKVHRNGIEQAKEDVRAEMNNEMRNVIKKAKSELLAQIRREIDSIVCKICFIGSCDAASVSGP